MVQTNLYPRKNLTQETCPNRGSNPGPLHDRRAWCCLAHNGGLEQYIASPKERCHNSKNVNFQEKQLKKYYVLKFVVSKIMKSDIFLLPMVRSVFHSVYELAIVLNKNFDYPSLKVKYSSLILTCVTFIVKQIIHFGL